MAGGRIDGVAWRKSSYSSGDGQCVEVADLGGRAAVRDSKQPDGPALTFAVAHWTSFLDAVRAGQFDQA